MRKGGERHEISMEKLMTLPKVDAPGWSYLHGGWVDSKVH